jgi:thiol-disulfide isomerase/thioredoxin
MTIPVMVAGAVGAALVGGLALTGCAGAADPSGPGAGAPGVATAQFPLDFTAATVSGTPFDGADSAGRPVVLWFWAPWCTVCRAEAPEVAMVADELDGRVDFLGVAGRGPLDDMARFVDQTSTGGFEHLADVDGALWRRFEAVAQPTFVFVAPSGATSTFAGSLGADELRERALDLEEQ